MATDPTPDDWYGSLDAKVAMVEAELGYISTDPEDDDIPESIRPEFLSLLDEVKQRLARMRELAQTSPAST